MADTSKAPVSKDEEELVAFLNGAKPAAEVQAEEAAFVARREFNQASADEEALTAWLNSPSPRPAGESPAAPAATRAAPATPSAPDGESTLGMVARNVADIPGAIAQGARNALQETMEAWISAGDWLEKNFPITPDALKIERPDMRLPDVASPESATGKIVQDVTQFLVGFVGAGKLKVFRALKPASRLGQAGKAGAQGAVADFVAMDPFEEKLSDLIEKHPELSNPVTRFLRADEDDNEAERRAKRAFEGLGLGIATDGLVFALRGLRAARRARSCRASRTPCARPTRRRAPASRPWA